MINDWVIIYSTNQEYQAEILKEVLDDNNIDSVIVNKKDSAYTVFGEIEVFVHYSNVIRAKIIVEEFEKAE